MCVCVYIYTFLCTTSVWNEWEAGQPQIKNKIKKKKDKEKFKKKKKRRKIKKGGKRKKRKERKRRNHNQITRHFSPSDAAFAILSQSLPVNTVFIRILWILSLWIS